MTSRSPVPTQRRITYINLETPNKDPSTIFHSPYTNGKRNKEYTNPTLISSNIFYDYKTNIETKSGQLDHSGKPKNPYGHFSNNQYDAAFDERSKTPERTKTPDHSKTPRRKRQFDNNQEHIKDHFSKGLIIQAEKKRALKKYLNSNNNFELTRPNVEQADIMKQYLGQIQDRTIKRSTSQINFGDVSQISGTDQQNLTCNIQNKPISTPMRRNHSQIFTHKKNEEDDQLSNTYSVNRGNQEKQQQQQQLMTPQRKQQENLYNQNSGYLQRSLTPTARKYKQEFTPLKECCNQCINEKIISDKHQKIKQEKEKEQFDQQLIYQKQNEEMTLQKLQAKEKKIQTRRQYDNYVKIKIEQENAKKQELIQNNIATNQKMNKLLEQEQLIELERMKQQKISKVKMYSQQLKDQIEQKEFQRKDQIIRERQEQERNKNLFMQKTFSDTKDLKYKKHPNVIEYRDQLLNQQIENEVAKNKEKYLDQQIYRKIQEQVSKYSEQEKEMLRKIKQQKKQDYEQFMKQKQSYAQKIQQEKKIIENEARQQFKNIENEDYQQRIIERKTISKQKQNFCNILKEQIFQKEILQEEQKREDLRKSTSTTLFLNKSNRQQLQNSLSPCKKCDKQVPKNQLAYFD